MTRAEFLASAEREYWLALLAQGLSRQEMAKIAGINKSYTYHRLQSLGLTTKQLGLGNVTWRIVAPETARRLNELSVNVRDSTDCSKRPC